jgi:hypothetical protein
MLAYIGYQILFVNDPAQPQRLMPLAPDLAVVGSVLGQFWENAKAVLGLPYYDAEIQGPVGGIGTWTTPAPYIAAAAGAVACLVLISRIPAPTAGARLRYPAYLLAGMAVLSVGVFATFALLRIGGFAGRYSAATMALIPLAITVLCCTVARPRTVRVTSAIFAVIAVAVSIDSLVRAEVLVNQANRDLLTRLKPYKAVVVSHTGWPVSPTGMIDASYPGLTSTFKHGLQDPMRPAMVAERALRHYANVQLGTACRIQDDGLIAVYYRDALVKVAAKSDVQAFGLPDRAALEIRALELDEVCQPAP